MFGKDLEVLENKVQILTNEFSLIQTEATALVTRHENETKTIDAAVLGLETSTVDAVKKITEATNELRSSEGQIEDLRRDLMRLEINLRTAEADKLALSETLRNAEKNLASMEADLNQVHLNIGVRIVASFSSLFPLINL